MDFKENQPIYLQIADLFCDNILERKWKAGEKIPSVREVAVMMEVNPNTVMRTFAHLQEMEIIFNKRGIGYFVAPDGRKKIQKMKRDLFFNKELPELFKAMDVLGISMEELKEIHSKQEK